MSTPTSVPTPEVVRLRMQFQPGETHEYRFTVHTSSDVPGSEGADTETQMKLRYRIESVDQDGSATMTATIEELTVMANGKSKELPEANGTTVQMRITPDGKTSDAKLIKKPLTGATSGNVDSQDLNLFTEYPLKSLAVNDSYDGHTVMNLPVLTNPVDVTTRTELTAIKSLNGHQIAELVQTMALSRQKLLERNDVTGTIQMDGKMTNEIDSTTGWPLSGHGTINVTILASQPSRPQPLRIGMTLNLHFERQQ